MQIDVAVARKIEHPLRNNAPVGDYENGVGCDGFESLTKLRVVLDLLRLHDRDRVLERSLLYGRCLQLLGAPDGAVGLRKDERDLVTGSDHSLKRGDGELRGSAEDKFHSCLESPDPGSDAGSSRFTTRRS
jgi:hypothetical protein